MDVINAPDYSGAYFTFSGYINDCNGEIVFHTVVIDHNHVGAFMYYLN